MTSAALDSTIGPCDPDAEAALLGSLLLDQDLIGRVGVVVRDVDFCEERNARLFRFLATFPGPWDVVNICAGLSDAGELGAIGNKGRIAELVEFLPSGVHGVACAEIVRKRSDRRAIRALGLALSRAASDADVATALHNLDQARAEAHTQGEIYSVADLAKRTFPKREFAIDGVLPVGLNLLVGNPKIGKSWMALDFAIAVASRGVALGKWKASIGDVIYLGLEDTDRRMAERLTKVDSLPLNGSLEIAHEWPKLGDGAEAKFRTWLRSHPKAKLIVIDTLARILPTTVAGSGTKYEIDVALLGPLQRLASEAGVCMLALHHRRKLEAVDLLDTVSGSIGITAVADTVIMLDRPRNRAEGVAFITGRDVHEASLAVRFDAPAGRWSVTGDAAAFQDETTRDRILTFIESVEEPVDAREVADATDLSYDTARRTLNRMKRSRQIASPQRGRFTSLSQCPKVPIPTNSAETPERDNETDGTHAGAGRNSGRRSNTRKKTDDGDAAEDCGYRVRGAESANGAGA